MKLRVASIVRVAAGAMLLVLSIRALGAAGYVHWLAIAEIVAALAFCLPSVWRIGGAALLAIMMVAIAHHALLGQFAASLVFAALVILMVLVHERP